MDQQILEDLQMEDRVSFLSGIVAHWDGEYVVAEGDGEVSVVERDQVVEDGRDLEEEPCAQIEDII